MPKLKMKMDRNCRLNAISRSMTELHQEFRSHERKTLLFDYQFWFFSLHKGKERVKRAKARHKENPAHKKTQERNLILKPKGRAGRRDGYKLIVAMGLEGKKEHYNALIVKLTIYVLLIYILTS